MAIYPLRLAGWEQSTIGCDDQMGGWFAKLWPNNSSSEVRVSGSSVEILALRVRSATGIAAAVVDAAIEEASGALMRVGW